MNQQPQGGETRNLIVAVVLSMAVFVVWFLLFPTPDKAKQEAQQQAQAQHDWIEHTTALVEPTVLAHPSCKSWYNGANVPGKKRRYMGYTAGIPEYRRRCDEVAAAGYTGFDLL